MKDFNPECYRIHMDIKDIDVDNLVTILIKYGDVIFDGQYPVIFLKNDVNRDEVIKALNKEKITNLFFESISTDCLESGHDIVTSWYAEKYNSHFRDYLELACQEKLAQAIQNVEKISMQIDEIRSKSNDDKEGGS